MRRAILICALALAGCATSPGPDKVQTVEVDKPVPVSCVPADTPQLPTSDVTDASLRQATDAAARYRELAEFYTLYAPLIPNVSAILEACRAAGPAPK